MRNIATANNSTQPVVVHAVGDFSSIEFQPAWRLLAAETNVVHDRTLAAARERIEQTGRRPELFVVAQQRPHEWDDARLDCLQRLAPLARFIGVLGSWCEGELRSGAPWPGMIRTYWHQWNARWGDDLRTSSAAAPGWMLSTAATSEDRLLALAPVESIDAKPFQVGVYLENHDLADLLSDVCRSMGGAAERLPAGMPTAAVDLMLWDGRAGEAASLARLHAAQPATPLLALVDFPRFHDWLALLEAGAAAVVTKPFLIGDLQREIVRLLAPPVEVN